MPKTAHRQEIEVKLRVSGIAAIRACLKRLRAAEISPRTYESNTLYDTPQSDLRRRGQLIRIRTEQPASRYGKKSAVAGAAILTYKGPPIRSRGGTKTRGDARNRSHFKIREEAEVSLSGPDELARIFRALGLRPMFRYEKFRTTYALPGVRGLKVELDETPVGTYLELEGPVAAIDRGARLLGYRRADYLKDSYGSLYLAACRKRCLKPGNMLFPATKKLRYPVPR
jgi:adenylate cyclase, class 2